MDRDEFYRRLEAIAKIKHRDQVERLAHDTGGVTIVELLPRPRPCGDCGLVVDSGPNRLITYRNKDRKVRCNTCGFLFNPETGRFDKLLFVRKKDDPPSK